MVKKKTLTVNETVGTMSVIIVFSTTQSFFYSSVVSNGHEMLKNT
jgi:hypothetical protein